MDKTMDLVFVALTLTKGTTVKAVYANILRKPDYEIEREYRAKDGVVDASIVNHTETINPLFALG